MADDEREVMDVMLKGKGKRHFSKSLMGFFDSARDGAYSKVWMSRALDSFISFKLSTQTP